MCQSHQHQDTQKIVNRLSRATGHLQFVKRMVEEGRDCSEVLIQLAAVRAAINNIGKMVLHDHMEHCIATAIAEGDTVAIEKFNKALDQFLK